MLTCPECFQCCFLCLEVLQVPDCHTCELLRAEHRKQHHANSSQNDNISGFTLPQSNTTAIEFIDLELQAAQEVLESCTDVALPGPISSSISPPIARRREWTDCENRDFEKWITSKPKPTKQEKEGFASNHTNLTVSQVQNKINNWRSGRNIQRKQISRPEGRGERRREVIPGTETVLSEWSEDVFQFFDPAKAPTELQTKQNNIIERDAVNLFTDIPNDIFEALSVEDEKLITRTGSPASSLMRYIESSELEADPKDIEMTLQRASHEELGAETQNSECMRLPSLKHQTSSEIFTKGPEGDNTITEQNRRCDNCKQEDLECDGDLPCGQCDKANKPCSNCLLSPHKIRTLNRSFKPYAFDFSWMTRIGSLPTVATPATREAIPKKATSGDEKRSNISGRMRHSKETQSTAAAKSPGPVQIPRKAQSVVSAHSSSHSVGSTHSARYSVKLQRRMSANNRRHSAAEVRIDAKIARPASVTSIKRNSAGTRNDGRAEYYPCLVSQCSEILASLDELVAHRESFHFLNHCTFCYKSFRDWNRWHSHERAHIMEKLDKECDNILWSCGICGTFGLRKSRRYMHIRHHWEARVAKDDWKGCPQLMPLKGVDAQALESMSFEVFQITAEHLLSAYAQKSEANRSESKNPQTHSAVSPSKSKIPTVGSGEIAAETSRPMVHGMFASLRRRLPLFRSGPP